MLTFFDICILLAKKRDKEVSNTTPSDDFGMDPPTCTTEQNIGPVCKATKKRSIDSGIFSTRSSLFSSTTVEPQMSFYTDGSKFDSESGSTIDNVSIHELSMLSNHAIE